MPNFFAAAGQRAGNTELVSEGRFHQRTKKLPSQCPSLRIIANE